jgi:cysteine desulfurase
MHGNNEIGNLLDLNAVGDLCEQYNAVFHSDTVQTVGHLRHDLKQLKTNFIVGLPINSMAERCWLLYVNNVKIHPYIHGGSQERNMRGGTENVYGIVGLVKRGNSLQRYGHTSYAFGKSKKRMIAGFREKIEEVRFNGDCESLERSNYTVLNVSLPPSDINDMLLFNLDIAKISASGGSACSSGSEIGSHVLGALGVSPDRGNVRRSRLVNTIPKRILITGNYRGGDVQNGRRVIFTIG